MRFAAIFKTNFHKSAVFICLLISSVMMAQHWSGRLLQLNPGMSMELNREMPAMAEIDFGYMEAATRQMKRDVQLYVAIQLEDELPSRPRINDFFAYTLSIQRIWGDLVLSLSVENILQYSSEKFLDEASLNQMDNGDSTLILESETPYLLGVGIAYTL